MRFAAAVQPRIEHGYARIGAGGWLDFVPAAGLPAGITHRSYPPHRVYDVDWLRDLPTLVVDANSVSLEAA